MVAYENVLWKVLFKNLIFSMNALKSRVFKCPWLISFDFFSALLAHLELFFPNPLVHVPSSSSSSFFFTPSMHPSFMYSLFGPLAKSASWTMSWQNRLPEPINLSLHFLISAKHFFFHPIYIHFLDNWLPGNGNAADNLLEPSYALLSSQASYLLFRTKETILCHLRIAHSQFTNS